MTTTTMIPVKEEDRLAIRIKGKGKKDYFTKFGGYIIFVTNIPVKEKDPYDNYMLIEVVAVKEKFGFGRFIEWSL